MTELRRWASFLLSVLCLSSALTGTALAAANPSSEIKHGGTLNVADYNLSWTSLDPQNNATTATVATIYDPDFQGLFVFDAADAQLEPELATSYKFSPNHTSLTIKLRHGVTFQDGTPLNANAVVYDIQRMASATVDSVVQPYFTNMTSVVPDGNYAVTLNFSVPAGFIVNILGGQAGAFIVSPTAVQSEGAAANQFGANPVGTGPYRFSSEVIDSNIIYNKWPGYWDKSHAGYYSTIDITSIANDQSCIEAVAAGTAQICAGGNVSDALVAKGIKSIKIYKAPAVSVEFVQFNMTQPPFNNIWARKAVAQAINVPEILKVLYHNQLTPTESAITPTSWAFDGNRIRGYPQFNLNEAKQDLAQLPGGTLSFQLSIPNDPNDVTFGEAVQSQLAAAGITATLNELQITTVLVDGAHRLYQGLALSTYGFPDPDTVFYKKMYSTSTNNQTGVDDPVLDNLILQARETVSRPQRKALYEQVQERLAIDLPEILFYAVPQYFFLAKHLQGFVDVGSGEDTFWSTYMG